MYPGKHSPVSAFAVYKSKKTKTVKITDHSPQSPPAKKAKNKDINSKINGNDFNLQQNGNKGLQNSGTSNKKTNGIQHSNTPQKSIKITQHEEVNSSKQKIGKKKLKESTPKKIKTMEKKLKKKNNKAKKIKLKKTSDDEEEPPTLIPIDTTNYQNDSSLSDSISDLTKTDPSPEGLKLFQWLIAPLSPASFFEKYWEREALHIQRDSSTYYSDILSTQRLDSIFREFPLYYTRNVDVVSYENGIKEVHNEEGRVVASALYDYYSNGCSIRVLNPHTYDQKVHLLITTLQEYFGTMVGANIYLTPPGSQGFAPHYDDIEAFVVQLEGKKHWKLYKPKGSDVLARDSSANLKHEDIGEPFMEVTLNAGDLLYFPRGTIHEGRTDPSAHSFHITVSVYQHNSYADLLEQALPVALKKAALQDLNFRQGLPVNYLKHTGYVNKHMKSKERKKIVENILKLVDTLKDHLDIDQAADQLGRKFMYDAMPPILSKQEVNYTSKYDGDFMKDGKIYNRVEIGMDTEVRLLRYYCLRLVVEDDSTAKIYYNTENAKYYHGEEEQFLSIDHSLIPCIQKLQRSYPKFIEVEDLPVEDNIAKAQLVSDLWERGLLVTNGPLPPVSDGESEDDQDGSVYEDDDSFDQIE